ncbi:MAG TPA: aspartate aminotransferase family protein [Candidatus Limnocylindrales bacterium]
MTATIDRGRLAARMADEVAQFGAAHPRSKALFERASRSLLGGVPMSWMAKWAGPYPVFVEEATGAHFRCVDGHDYLDFCLGDTGAMTGHSPEEAVAGIAAQLVRGITTMLPGEVAVEVGEELQRRFGLAFWQFTLSATDANRFALRLCRQITGRPYVLVFDHCYHGSVDETFATLRDGVVGPSDGNIGPAVDPRLTTKVVQWNDVAALEAALAPGDVAAVLAEPVMTNVGIVHPEPGYHDALRRLTRETGTLLVIDETHTICAGPGGYTRAEGLDPDLLTIGKAIGSGIPAGTYGLSQAVADRILAANADLELIDVGGVGGTLAGNALSLAAIRTTLAHVLTEANFARMIPLGERWTAGVQAAIDEFGVPWHVSRLGCRAEYLFRTQLPRSGAEAAQGMDFELGQYMHLHALNRGILLTPFHNMALMSPATTKSDVDRHTAAFREAVRSLVEA